MHITLVTSCIILTLICIILFFAFTAKKRQMDNFYHDLHLAYTISLRSSVLPMSKLMEAAESGDEDRYEMKLGEIRRLATRCRTLLPFISPHSKEDRELYRQELALLNMTYEMFACPPYFPDTIELYQENDVLRDMYNRLWATLRDVTFTDDITEVLERLQEHEYVEPLVQDFNTYREESID